MKKILFAILVLSLFRLPGAWALDTVYGGNYAAPELQSGHYQEAYEVKAATKLGRGMQNFFLCWLELGQGVRAEAAYRKSQYLPLGLDGLARGVAVGVMRSVGRFGTGLYEIFTFPIPQEPVMKELEGWAY